MKYYCTSCTSMISALCVNIAPPYYLLMTLTYFVVERLRNYTKETNTEETKISTWLKVNNLPPNIKKTHYIVFTRKKFKHQLDIRIDGHPNDEVHKTKFLDVFIDNELNWNDHISYLIGKISEWISMLIKGIQYFNKNGLIGLYSSFIYPYLIHCNHIWGCTYKSYLKK